jgi:hypothetical protein
MAKIAAGSLYNFKTGDIVDADVAPQGGALNPIFETIRVALNDTDTRVDNTYTKTEVDTMIAESQAGVVGPNSVTDTKMAPDVKIGSLASLGTTVKTSITAALNEVVVKTNNSVNKDVPGEVYGDFTIYKMNPQLSLMAGSDLAASAKAVLAFKDMGGSSHWKIETQASEDLGPTTLNFVNQAGVVVASLDQAGRLSITDPLSNGHAATRGYAVAKAGDTMTGDLVVSKASAQFVASATTGNPVLRLRENGSERGIMYYDIASDSLILLLIGTDGATSVNQITMSANNTTFTDQITAPGVNCNGGGNVLAVMAGPSADHAYMSFYADSQAQAARSAYFGYASAGVSSISLVNEMNGGGIDINTTNGVVNINGLPMNFPRTLASNGYQKLPSGVIIQWGTIVVANGAQGNVTFPIVFPTYAMSVQLTVEDSNTSSTVAHVIARSASGFSCRHSQVVGVTVNWFAVGY